LNWGRWGSVNISGEDTPFGRTGRPLHPRSNVEKGRLAKGQETASDAGKDFRNDYPIRGSPQRDLTLEERGPLRKKN